MNKEYAVVNFSSDKLDAGFTRCEDICYLEEQLAKYAGDKSSRELPAPQVKFGHEVLIHTLINTHDLGLGRNGNDLKIVHSEFDQHYRSYKGDIPSPPPRLS